MTNIATQTMVLNCHFGMWEGQRLDKNATIKLTEEAQAHADAARVNKHLVAKQWLQPIVTARSALRNHFTLVTLPWKDNGDRLLPRTLYMDFIQAHGTLKKNFQDAVNEFLERGYPTAIEQAEFRMGSLFKPEDYPDPEILRPKFYVRLVIDAVTEAKDFRVEMNKTQLAEIRSEMDAAMNLRVARAMGDVWKRVGTALEHFVTKMTDENAIFRDSTVTHLVEIVEMLPAMNIMNDPGLTKVGEDIRDALHGLEAKEFRTDKMLRKSVAKTAQAINKRFKGLATIADAASFEDEL